MPKPTLPPLKPRLLYDDGRYRAEHPLKEIVSASSWQNSMNAGTWRIGEWAKPGSRWLCERICSAPTAVPDQYELTYTFVCREQWEPFDGDPPPDPPRTYTLHPKPRWGRRVLLLAFLIAVYLAERYLEGRM